ncbi:hypothetical protein SMD11_0280 [Streptomyces albireticuli]|uniref:Uncharacterized protein n=1 Tax=Streptomyces albireticuli TaxID=1940 RepID=A0A1Z2KVB5_9ACTN|nr:hypothetical protein SMD11_0280 [Streptomyces albireticuli]
MSRRPEGDERAVDIEKEKGQRITDHDDTVAVSGLAPKRSQARPHRVLSGHGTVKESKQHGRLRTELRGSVSMRGRGQLRRDLQPLGSLGAHDLHDIALAQLAPHRLGDAYTGRRMLKGHAAELRFINGYRLGVVQRGECRAQGTHRRLVTGTHRFRQRLTHTKSHRHTDDLMAAPLAPTTRYTHSGALTAE